MTEFKCAYKSLVYAKQYKEVATIAVKNKLINWLWELHLILQWVIKKEPDAVDIENE